MHISQAQLCGLVLMASVAGALISSVMQVHADQDPRTDNVPRVLPYQGTLELDGTPLNASGEDAIEILFTLYDGPGEDAPAVYNQLLTIEVFAGRFTAPIGPFGTEEESIQSVISAADDLYLGMTLIGDPENEEDDIALNGRQRILAAPFTLWSSSASNFTVANNLNVGGQATFREDLTVNGASILNGNVEIGADGEGSLVLNNGHVRLGGDSDASLANDGPLLIGNEAGRNITIDSNEIMARDNGSTAALNLNVEGGQVQVGSADNNANLNVQGTIRGNFAIARRSATVTVNGNTTVNCNTGEKAISCGFAKTPANDEDMMTCTVNSNVRGCTIQHDQSGGVDSGLRAHCICLDVSP